MSRFTNDWIKKLIEKQNRNRDKIIDWLKNYDFIKINVEYEFVTLNIGTFEIYLDFGITGKAICNIYENDNNLLNYETKKVLLNLSEIKDFIKNNNEFKRKIRELKLRRINNLYKRTSH